MYNYGNSQVKVIVWIRTVSGFSEGQVWYNSGINGLNISAIQDRIVAGDFNGDGKTDIGVVYDCGNSETKVYTFISSGNSFEKQLWISSPVGSIDAMRVTGRVVAGDFSGDGKDDIAGIYDYGGATAGVIVWKSTGTSFSDSSLWDRTAEGSAYATSFTERVVTVDYNGDGKDDIAGIYDYSNGTSRLLVWTSQGTSFETFKLGYKIGTSFTISQLTGKIVGGDYNKDGKDDIGLITTINNKGIIYVFNSIGTAYAAPEELWNTDNIISYKYNDNGIRTSKTVGGVETKYYLDGSKVIYEKTGEDVIYYSYDENGQVIGMNRNGAQYYYIKNAQNDVIGLLDNTLQQIVSYKYTSWGEIVSVKDSTGNEITDSNNIGLINPYRYRSYRYDSETGLYYLQSRYYNAEWGRFLNADGVLNGAFAGNNLYAYCGNNPVNMYDPDGYETITLGILLNQFLSVAVPILAVGVAVVGALTVGVLIAKHINDGESAATVSNDASVVTPTVTTAVVDPNSNNSNDDEFDKKLNSQTSNVKKGYDSFRKLKKSVGSAGQGNEWHHIVEQSQIKKSGFDVQMIQNEKNIISINRGIHRKISGYYSRKNPLLNGMSPREWLTGKSFEFQHEYGLQVLKMFM